MQAASGCSLAVNLLSPSPGSQADACLNHKDDSLIMARLSSAGTTHQGLPDSLPCPVLACALRSALANLHASQTPGSGRSALQSSQRTAPQASLTPRQILRPFRVFLHGMCTLVTPQLSGAMEDPVTNPALPQFESTLCWLRGCKEALYPTIGCLHSPAGNFGTVQRSFPVHASADPELRRDIFFCQTPKFATDAWPELLLLRTTGLRESSVRLCNVLTCSVQPKSSPYDTSDFKAGSQLRCVLAFVTAHLDMPERHLRWPPVGSRTCQKSFSQKDALTATVQKHCLRPVSQSTSMQSATCEAAEVPSESKACHTPIRNMKPQKLGRKCLWRCEPKYPNLCTCIICGTFYPNQTACCNQAKHAQMLM